MVFVYTSYGKTYFDRLTFAPFRLSVFAVVLERCDVQPFVRRFRKFAIDLGADLLFFGRLCAWVVVPPLALTATVSLSASCIRSASIRSTFSFANFCVNSNFSASFCVIFSCTWASYTMSIRWYCPLPALSAKTCCMLRECSSVRKYIWKIKIFGMKGKSSYPRLLLYKWNMESENLYDLLEWMHKQDWVIVLNQ